LEAVLVPNKYTVAASNFKALDVLKQLIDLDCAVDGRGLDEDDLNTRVLRGC